LGFTDYLTPPRRARVAELADAPDLGSGGEIRRGSSPLPGIFYEAINVGDTKPAQKKDLILFRRTSV
jgi:hypothetical protein